MLRVCSDESVRSDELSSDWLLQQRFCAIKLHAKHVYASLLDLAIMWTALAEAWDAVDNGAPFATRLLVLTCLLAPKCVTIIAPLLAYICLVLHLWTVAESMAEHATRIILLSPVSTCTGNF